MAIEKKQYTAFDLQSITGLQEIYNQYFSKNNCTQLLNLLNKYSVADGILTSGNTSIVLEYKRRSMSVTQYDTVLIEKIKYDNLREASRLFNAPAFYVCDYDEAVLIFQLDFTTEGELDYIDMPVNRQNHYLIRKPVYHLPTMKADIIIGKKEWKRATRDELALHIKRKREI